MARQRIYRIMQALIAIGLLIALIIGWRWVSNPDEFPIEVVKVEATYQHLDKRKLQEKIFPFANRGFFGLSARQLKQQLLEIPWVAQVDIQRIWPGTIVIKITEETVLAQWGNDALMNIEGRIFKPPLNTFPTGAPHLIAQDDQAALMLKNYRAVSNMLKPLGMQVSEMTMDNRGAFYIRLSNGTQILLGQTDPLIRLQRFVKVYPKITASSSAQAKKIDLRYQNGLAVEWEQNYDELHNQ